MSIKYWISVTLFSARDEALSVDQLYMEELKEAGKAFAHYLGGAFGLKLPKPHGDSAGQESSKFSPLSIGDASDLMEAYSHYDLPETRELLQVLYEKLEIEEFYQGLDIENMVRAEFTLLGL